MRHRGVCVQVIRSKVRPPSPSGRVVSRPRLTSRLAELVERFGVVWVFGAAGAGKTTAVVEALADGPLGWLTLDSTEPAPGRLLAHLEAALGAGSVATDALAAQIGHVEAAGLLAEACQGELTLVVDEVERVADAEEAKAALSAFIRYAPPALRVVLISRRVVPLTLGSARAVGQLTEAELAFSVDEAAHALEAAGHANA